MIRVVDVIFRLNWIGGGCGGRENVRESPIGLLLLLKPTHFVASELAILSQEVLRGGPTLMLLEFRCVVFIGWPIGRPRRGPFVKGRLIAALL